jgi:uncharacterized RDD family membrane protein YckC
MTCSFCGSRNSTGEHRCRRCGRRPGDTLTGEIALHRTQGPLAMQVETQVVEPPEPRSIRGYQPSLFQQQGSNVIPIESYIPVEPKSRPQRTEAAPPKPRAPKRSRVPEEQGSLDFLASAPPKPRTLSTTVEAVIFCDAPVAVKLHRAVAAALDWIMVLLAYGVFLAVYSAMGGEFHGNKTNWIVFGSVLPLLGFVYGLMWALAGAETMGMRWTRLKLLTFDGFPPDPKQRLMRFAGSTLSLCTLIGLMWSLVDEESLGWQDHISRTFPTPSLAENLTLVRR